MSLSRPLARRVAALVESIPPGRVASYGQIARAAGCSPRQIGRLLAGLPADSGVPWHRVVNARGGISLPDPMGDVQRWFLENEGVAFCANGCVDLKRCGWADPESDAGDTPP